VAKSPVASFVHVVKRVFLALQFYAENDSEGLFRELADQSVLLEGDSIASTYLNGSAIIQAAKDTGADAIHPGFGFLSERAEFAQAVMDAGLIWDWTLPPKQLSKWATRCQPVKS
jgi:acetyl/propionyl-CoA carboxylase alpha subunit